MGYSAHTLVESVPSATAVVDADGQVLAANARWVRAGGLCAAEGAIFPDPARHGAGYAALRAALGAIAPGDEPVRVGCAGPDGDQLIHITPVLSDAGRAGRLVTAEPWPGGGSAVVPARPARPARTPHEDESVAVARAKSEFLALLGHEIRTPVTSVVGMVDLLRALPLAQDVREVVDGVHRSTHLLKSMIDDLLDLARLETGHLELNERPLSLYRLMEEVIEPLQQQVRQKGILLLAGVAPDVPAAVLGDPDRLRQVLTALVSNAVKFTETGEVLLTAARRDDGRLLIAVTDTGPGLAERDRGRVFAPFVQVDSSSVRRHEGAGLGLAIAARLVARMGGAIDVESEVGRGSRFRVLLPLAATDQPAVNAPDDAIRLVVRRVAVAAPSPSSFEVLSWMLAMAGAEAVPATLAELTERPTAADAVLWVDDSHDTAALGRASAVIDAIGSTARAIMISTTDPRRGVVRGPALITAPLTLRRLVAVMNRERTGVRGAPISVPPLPGGRVLLAEDNEVNRGVFRRMIALLGVECEVAGDGAQAVEAVLGEKPYDLVLMDMQMPGMDGLEATRRIRAAGSTTPILALTATSLRGDQARCLAAGMNGYLAKPITLKDLRRALAPYLEATPTEDVAPVAPEPTEPGPAITVDLERLRELEEQLADRPLVLTTVSTYLTELGGRRTALSEALSRRDRDALQAAAHTLKSSSALLGADTLAKACARVEQQAADAAEEELAALVAAVEHGATGTATVLAAYVADGARR